MAYPLDSDGDFRSDECIGMLKKADIVVTNPPFSLFREYVEQLMAHDKKFLILGSFNAIKYKEIFPLVQANKLWMGVNNGPKSYHVPDDAKRFTEMVEGRKIVKLGNTVWYTNLEHKKRHEELIFVKKYTPDAYPEYDNYHAINVNKVSDIPRDYEGVIGVPITFMDKYNPDQFEILGLDRYTQWGYLPDLIKLGYEQKLGAGLINGKELYARIFIKHRRVVS